MKQIKIILYNNYNYCQVKKELNYFMISFNI